MRIQQFLATGVFIAAGVAAGCGGGGGPAAPTAPTTPARTLTSIAVGGGDGIQVGTSAQMTARGTYSDTSTKDITKEVKWTSLSLDLATINGDGRLNALAPGTVTIQAALDGRTGSKTGGVRIRLLSVNCIHDCDGLLDGNGEFSYRAYYTVSGSATSNVIRQTSGYPSSGGAVSLGDGGSISLSEFLDALVVEDAGAYVDVGFRATEWDRDIFGQVFPDSAMNDRLATARWVWSLSNGWGSAVGIHTLTLTGSGSCAISLRYQIEALDR
jgi:hypothetical protein